MSELTEASEEALRRWPEIDTSAGGVISQSYAERYAMRRSGFAEGARWQAEQPVTDAQIEAAAEALVSTELNFDETMFSPSEVHEIWENRSFANREELRRKIRLALEAARKAVTA